MANIVLKTYAAGENNQGSVTPQNDALIYQATIPMNGIFSGAVITLSSANVLHVAAGMGIIGGRFFEVLESDIPVQLSVSGDLLGRLYIHLDLSNADNPIEINAVTGASLPALQGDPDLNISNGVFDMELCTFDINELTISNIVQTFPTITAANNQIRRATAYSVNDLVFCQSASKSLIFICTTAGTTAIQEPKAYQTVTDGNTVTDGTAVFKAVSVAGQITQISKIGNLSSLNTTDKSSAVAAINEVNTKLSKTEDLISNSGDAYDPTRPYKVGELCIYNDVLYRCITACSAGSWATNQSCFTQDTLTRVANDLNSGLTNLSTQIGGVKNVSISNTGDSATFDILFTDWSGFFRIECMNRRDSAKPFSAIVQKYTSTTNYVVLSNYATDESAFNCSNISGGIRVTLPFTYASVMVSSATSFTLSVV